MIQKKLPLTGMSSSKEKILFVVSIPQKAWIMYEQNDIGKVLRLYEQQQEEAIDEYYGSKGEDNDWEQIASNCRRTVFNGQKNIKRYRNNWINFV